ncbi:MAG: tetratricopeptide repeat protein [Planctomycetaceae bacterium]|nr:tetratricopeptide repeat protein [Planctomycetaceae bacterium]
MGRQQDHSPPHPEGLSQRWQVLAAYGMLVLGVGLVFGQTIAHPFINLDDSICVYQNRWVTQGFNANSVGWAFSQPYAGAWAPVVWLSHMLDWRLYGDWAGGHHLTNVLLHAASTLLLFHALRRMTGRLWPSLLAAALFSIHPLRVESVAWVTERKDMLSGLFFMLALCAYAAFAARRAETNVVIASSGQTPPGMRKKGRNSEIRGGRGVQSNASGLAGPYAAVTACFVLALMSKPSVVTLPFVLLLLDYWPLAPMGKAKPEAMARNARRLVLEKTPLFTLAAISCVVTLWAQAKAIQVNELYSFAWRLGHIPVAYVGYLVQFLHPVNLAVPYPRPTVLPFWHVLAASLLLALVTMATAATRRRYPYLLVGWLWYLGMLLPAIGVVQFGVQATADRFTYLPQIGLCIAMAWGFAELWQAVAPGDAETAPDDRHVVPTKSISSSMRRRWALSGAAVLAVVALVAAAWHQTTFWSDSETLWRHTIESTSNNSLAHSYLGNELSDQHRWEEALEEFQAALAIDPKRFDTLNNAGMALAALGREQEAVEHYRKALASNPECAEAYNNLATTLSHHGQWPEAIAMFAEAVRRRPERADWRSRYAEALMSAGRLAEATAELQETIRLQPDCVQALSNLAAAYAQAGQRTRAMETARRALQLAERDINEPLIATLRARLAEYQRAASGR